MYSDEFKKLLKPIVMIQYFVWMAYFLSLAIYVFAAYQVGITSKIAPLSGQALYIMAGVFSFLALLMFPMAFILKRFMLPMKKLREVMRSDELPPGAGSGLTKERRELFEKLNDEEKRLYYIAGKTFKPTLMIFGCYNTIGILGLPFSFASGAWQYVIPFVFVAAIATLTACPDPEKLFEKLLKADEYKQV